MGTTVRWGLRKRGTKIRADGQELDLRFTASDERATDGKVRRSALWLVSAVGLIAGDLLHVSDS